MRRGPKPAKAKVEAKPPVSRKSPDNGGARVRELEKRLAEALRRETEALKREAEAQQQQTATAEILRVIGASPGDVQPVFNAIAVNALRLCDAYDVIILRMDGDVLRRVAHHGPIPPPPDPVVLLTRDTVGGRTLLDARPIHVADLQTESEEFPVGSRFARQLGSRTVLGVPLLEEGAAVGAIYLRRAEVQPFTESQIALLQTFAAQAVLAMENVRLFTELQEKNRALTEAHAQVSEALEQQTATSEILRVISSSPTDVQPVFNTIVTSAGRLCGAESAVVYRFEEEMADAVALYNLNPDAIEAYHRRFPRRLHDTDHLWRVADGSVLNIADIANDPHTATGNEAFRARDVHSFVLVPMVRDEQAIGAIGVAHHDVGAFSEERVRLLKTFAAQAVIAIENVRLFTELQGKNAELTQAHAQVTEALEQQTATSEILRVISSSPGDIQPVFDTIAANAARLCDAVNGLVIRFDGQLLHLVAHHNVDPERLAAVRQAYPRPPSRGALSGRAILTRAVVHVPDVSKDPEYKLPAATTIGYRSVLAVPMMHQGVARGTILIARDVVAPFSDAHIALIQTFADQAVIAIENVRLFNETKEALERQTATADILRVISGAHTEAQPVFDTIVQSAVRLCNAATSAVFLTDGRMLYEPANYGSSSPEALAATRARYPRPLDMHTTGGIAVLTRSVVHVPDTEDPSAIEWIRQSGRMVGFRSVVTVPMLREGDAIGAILVTRREPGPFSDAEVELLKTFADQAVIAIENVRLFTELQKKNQALTQAHAQVSEALEQQTATAEILKVISSSPTDVQPVFDAIAQRAMTLCGAQQGAVLKFDGELIHIAAVAHMIPGWAEIVHRAFPRRPGRGSASARAIMTRAVVHVADVLTEPEYELREGAARVGIRAVLSVPMVREEHVVGTITLDRTEARPFSENQIALLQTFADQAVIAIENVRLFKELEARNRELTEALERQTATSSILEVISRSQTDLQAVFDAIVRSAVTLTAADIGAVLRTDGRQFFLAAQVGDQERLKAVERLHPRPVDPSSLGGRAILTRTIQQVEDVEASASLPDRSLNIARAAGFRSNLVVPMLRGAEALGVISVARRDPGPFSEAQTELLKTFADQAVIAIENARLFNELQARTGELTRSVEKLTALGEVGRAVSSTLDLETVLTTIVSRAVELSGLDGGVVFEYDDRVEEFVQRVGTETGQALAEARRTTRIRKGEGVLGRTAITLEPVQVPDITAPGAYAGRLREALIGSGIRAVLAVPMLREGQLIGCLGVTRNRPGEFPTDTIELLRTFATQSALAIQNARLFHEIEVKSRQLEAASQHKSEFLANMSHELRTPLNAIIGFSEVLTERMFGELNEKQDEYLKDIYASGQHLLSLINDILDLSKIEAGRMELELADFHLPQAIDNALVLVRERALRRGITLEQSIDPRLGEMQGDERKIKQVLLNLLSNAIKFTPEGGRVGVRAEPVNEYVEVAVSDTGVGIAPEDHEAVFEEFRQVGTVEKKAEGTGLGLALARKFIELHGGRIWVTSEVGAGSTFTFTLPVRRGE